MIINLFISFIFMIIGVIFSFFPVVSISTIPLFGEYVYPVLVTAFVTWSTVMETFPYFYDAFYDLILVIIPFELIMVAAKFLIGRNRMPVNDE